MRLAPAVIVAIVLMAVAWVSPLTGQQSPEQTPVPATKVTREPVAKAKSQPDAAAATLAPKGPIIEAKTVFGAIGTAAPLPARAIGFYSRGCLAGAKPLPIDGPVWQAMRLSRNRNWGHPELIQLIERLAQDAKAQDGWPGLLVGDMSQPRGGPMLTGHASHQVGLDADIWLTPMPSRRLSAKEREDLSATSMLAADGIYVDPKVWTKAHGAVILRAASYQSVERILVHPGIKMALCQVPGTDPAALGKVRPFWGHHYHMHIRIGCPKDSVGCQPQPPVPANDTGCGKEVDDWIALLKRPPIPADPTAKAAPPKPGLSLDQLPVECRMVINAGAPAVARRPGPGTTVDAKSK